MTIGKRKGAAAKGAGSNSRGTLGGKVGGSLSKGDHWYLQEAWGLTLDPGAAPAGASSAPDGHTATGGIVNDYVAPDGVYRAHIFTSSGIFTISALSENYPANIEYLVVGGGGAGGDGGGNNGNGGGGAGGLRTNLSGHPLAGAAFPVGASTYYITIGAGGQGTYTTGNAGSESTFKLGGNSYPGALNIRGAGGLSLIHI